jgi:hypothetical protein
MEKINRKARKLIKKVLIIQTPGFGPGLPAGTPLLKPGGGSFSNPDIFV